MKIGVITPTTGKRPILLLRNRYYMGRQTVKPDAMVILTDDLRLTDKYRKGIELIKDKVDLIFFCEDDDYYPPEYFETMLSEYKKAGSPDVFGVGETFFYHPELQGVWHKEHSSEGPCTFQMCLRSDAVDRIDWSQINHLFMDAGIWRQLKGEVVKFGRPLAIGIKHGRGICGAGGHNKWFYDDKSRLQSETEWAKYDPEWLRKMIGDDADWYEEFGRNGEII